MACRILTRDRSQPSSLEQRAMSPLASTCPGIVWSRTRAVTSHVAISGMGTRCWTLCLPSPVMMVTTSMTAVNEFIIRQAQA